MDALNGRTSYVAFDVDQHKTQQLQLRDTTCFVLTEVASSKRDRSRNASAENRRVTVIRAPMCIFGRSRSRSRCCCWPSLLGRKRSCFDNCWRLSCAMSRCFGVGALRLLGLSLFTARLSIPMVIMVLGFNYCIVRIGVLYVCEENFY